MKTIFYYLLVFLFTASLAKAQSASGKKKAAENKATIERQRSLGGQRTENELKDDKHQIQPTNHLRGTPANSAADTSDVNPNKKNQQTPPEVVPTNKDQGSAANDNGNNANNSGSSSQGNSSANNAPAVIQRTSSESGSPSVLSKNNGSDRDGTNNVQRSTYNMAGAKVSGNWNLDKKNRQGQNINTDSTRIKKQEEQPQREIPNGQNASKQGDQTMSEGSNGQANGQSTVQDAGALKNKDKNSDKGKSKDKTQEKSKKKDKKSKGKDSGK
jgi:hypothetical protein